MANTAPLLSAVQVGTRVGRYELLHRVGGGGYGSVWAAQDCGFGRSRRPVAVKLLHPWLRGNRDVCLAVIDEARITRRIVHPNVVQILDVGEHDLGAYLVMELIDGSTLSDLHRRALKAGRRLPIGTVLGILADACAGLHAAHEARDERGRPLFVVHRDVSPRNVLVTNAGSAKLIDFGNAKARGRLQGETVAGAVKGTLRYMAPEQATGGHVDRSTDVWGIGAVLHALIAGAGPYAGGTSAELMQSLRTAGSNPPLDPSIPQALRAVLARALERDPRRRFQTAHALREALLDAATTLRVDVATARALAETSPYESYESDERGALVQTSTQSSGETEEHTLCGPTARFATSRTNASNPTPFVRAPQRVFVRHTSC